ncbi:MAG: Maf family protein, partial [Pseudomonadota bacterium]|nr:Maf family protein [Pseudomonadota bacterium]
MPSSLQLSQRRLILASTSVTRRELLTRLGLAFECIAPEVDEVPLPHESPAQLAYRLSVEKAAAVAKQYPDAWVIGSDQVAVLLDQQAIQQGQPIGKPLTTERAIQQLQQASGRTLRFGTGVSLQCAAQGYVDTALIPFEVTFRTL